MVVIEHIVMVHLGFFSIPLNNLITTFLDITNYDTPTTDTMRVSISTTGVYMLNDL